MWDCRRYLDLGRDPALVTHLGEQLVEQYRLADPAQPDEDPSTVALAELVDLAAHYGEPVQDGLPSGEHRGLSSGSSSKGTGHWIHV
jgi:hypothetical protein